MILLSQQSPHIIDIQLHILNCAEQEQLGKVHTSSMTRCVCVCVKKFQSSPLFFSIPLLHNRYSLLQEDSAIAILNIFLLSL